MIFLENYGIPLLLSSFSCLPPISYCHVSSIPMPALQTSPSLLRLVYHTGASCLSPPRPSVNPCPHNVLPCLHVSPFFLSLSQLLLTSVSPDFLWSPFLASPWAPLPPQPQWATQVPHDDNGARPGLTSQFPFLLIQLPFLLLEVRLKSWKVQKDGGRRT